MVVVTGVEVVVTTVEASGAGVVPAVGATEVVPPINGGTIGTIELPVTASTPVIVVSGPTVVGAAVVGDSNGDPDRVNVTPEVGSTADMVVPEPGVLPSITPSVVPSDTP